MNAEEKRAKAVYYMKMRAKRNTYTNGGNRSLFFGDPEGADGYSDCSSAVRACIERASGIDIGRNTDKQIRNYKKGLLVENTTNSYPDESKLKPGDCLYFKGNRNHVKQVGHVEMYTGPNECWGHGSGKGPTRKDLRRYCEDRAKNGRRYFCTIRWILDDEADAVPDLEDTQTVTSAGWKVYDALPSEPNVLTVIDEGTELRVYGEKDGYVGIKSLDGKVKGYIRREAFESPAETDADD